MKHRVAIDLYSGIPNPTWYVDDLVAKEWQGRLRKLPQGSLPANYRERRSGFKGMTILAEQDGQLRAYTAIDGFVFQRGTDQVWLDHGRVVERWLFGTAPAPLLGQFGLTYETVTAPPPGIFKITGIGGSGKVGGLACSDAPSYPGNTGVWKGGLSAPPNPNNCYSYANNDPIVFGEAGVPGPGATSIPSTTATMLSRLKLDKLDVAIPKNKLPTACLVAPGPNEAHYLAVCWRKAPGSMKDFHCLRLDRNGKWSHKDGTGPVVNDDINGNVIDDLRTAQFDAQLSLIGFFASIEGKRQID